MTATQETYKPEYVIYRLRDGRVNYVPRGKWNAFNVTAKQYFGAELVAEGLTEQQAHDYCRLIKET